MGKPVRGVYDVLDVNWHHAVIINLPYMIKEVRGFFLNFLFLFIFKNKTQMFVQINRISYKCFTYNECTLNEITSFSGCNRTCTLTWQMRRNLHKRYYYI